MRVFEIIMATPRPQITGLSHCQLRLRLLLIALLLFAVPTGCHPRVMGPFMGHSGPIQGIALSADGLELFSASADTTLRKWSTQDQSLLAQVNIDPISIEVVGEYVFASTGGGTIEQLMRGNLGRVRTFSGHNPASSGGYTSPVWTVRVSRQRPDLMMSCGQDRTVRFWAISSGSLVSTINAGRVVWDCAFGSVNGTFVASFNDGSADLMNIDSGTVLRTFSVSGTIVRRIFVHGNSLFMTGTSFSAHEFDLVSGNTLKVYGNGGNAVTAQNDQVYFGTNGGVVTSFNTSTRQSLGSFQAPSLKDVWYLVAHDRFLYSAHNDPLIYMWDLNPVATISTYTSQVQLTLPSFNIGAETTSIRGGDKDPPNHTIGADTLELWIVLALIAVFLMLVCLLALIYRLRRTARRRVINNYTSSTKALHSSVENASSDLQLSSITGLTSKLSNLTDKTTLMSAHELSIPAFLQKEYGSDFILSGHLIAKGGNGAIYRCQAIDKDISARSQGADLICKVVDMQGLDRIRPRIRQGFLQELSIVWRFRDNPLFPRLYAYSIQPVAMVMKFYECGDLLQYIESSRRHSKINVAQFPYTKKRIVKIFKKFIMAVEAMHSAGFAHCDIKPQNVLLDISATGQDLIPVLCDFGLAQVLDARVLKVEAFEISTLRGFSWSYAAPDTFHRARDKTASHDPDVIRADDVYALGVTILHMLKRTPVWE